MNRNLTKHFDAEMAMAKAFYANSDWAPCFHHLERAHVLGQPNAWLHTVTHWWMLKVGLRSRDGSEIFGQIVRLLGAGIASILRRAPLGNTGGANVGIFTPMPIPADLAAIIAESKTR